MVLAVGVDKSHLGVWCLVWSSSVLVLQSWPGDNKVE